MSIDKYKEFISQQARKNKLYEDVQIAKVKPVKLMPPSQSTLAKGIASELSTLPSSSLKKSDSEMAAVERAKKSAGFREQGQEPGQWYHYPADQNTLAPIDVPQTNQPRRKSTAQEILKGLEDGTLDMSGFSQKDKEEIEKLVSKNKELQAELNQRMENTKKVTALDKDAETMVPPSGETVIPKTIQILPVKPAKRAIATHGGEDEKLPFPVPNVSKKVQSVGVTKDGMIVPKPVPAVRPQAPEPEASAAPEDKPAVAEPKADQTPANKKQQGRLAAPEPRPSKPKETRTQRMTKAFHSGDIAGVVSGTYGEERINYYVKFISEQKSDKGPINVTGQPDTNPNPHNLARAGETSIPKNVVLKPKKVENKQQGRLDDEPRDEPYNDEPNYPEDRPRGKIPRQVTDFIRGIESGQRPQDALRGVVGDMLNQGIDKANRELRKRGVPVRIGEESISEYARMIAENVKTTLAPDPRVKTKGENGQGDNTDPANPIVLNKDKVEDFLRPKDSPSPQEQKMFNAAKEAGKPAPGTEEPKANAAPEDKPTRTLTPPVAEPKADQTPANKKQQGRLEARPAPQTKRDKVISAAKKRLNTSDLDRKFGSKPRTKGGMQYGTRTVKDIFTNPLG